MSFITNYRSYEVVMHMPCTWCSKSELLDAEVWSNMDKMSNMSDMTWLLQPQVQLTGVGLSSCLHQYRPVRVAFRFHPPLCSMQQREALHRRRRSYDVRERRIASHQGPI